MKWTRDEFAALIYGLAFGAAIFLSVYAMIGPTPTAAAFDPSHRYVAKWFDGGAWNEVEMFGGDVLRTDDSLIPLPRGFQMIRVDQAYCNSLGLPADPRDAGQSMNHFKVGKGFETLHVKGADGLTTRVVMYLEPVPDPLEE